MQVLNKTLIIGILSCCLSACNSKKVEYNFQTNYFKMTCDSDLHLQIVFESNNLTKIVIQDSNDTIYVVIGSDIWNLAEEEPEVLYVPAGVTFSNMDTAGLIIVHDVNYDIDKFRRQNVFYESLNDYQCKISIPRVFSKGYTGMYIENVCEGFDMDTYGIISFTIYAENLSKTNQQLFLKAIRTIKLNKSLPFCN